MTRTGKCRVTVSVIAKGKKKVSRSSKLFTVKAKKSLVTGTPSEILNKLRADVLAMERKTLASGDFGSLDPKRTALSAKYSGAATLTYNRAVSGGNYTAKSGDLTQVWFVEIIDAELVLVER